MKKLKSTSVFKLILLCLLSYYLRSIYIIALSLIILLFDDYRLVLLFLIYFVLLNVFVNMNDFIPVGIIEYKYNNYYLVDKLLYKVKLYTDDNLLVGDVLYFDSFFKQNYIENDIKKSILFYGEKYKCLFNFYPRLLINNLINNSNKNIKPILDKFLYNITDYDDLKYNLGYGLSSYYFFNEIRKRNKILCLFLLLIYNSLFNMDAKFILIYISLFLYLLNFDKLKKYCVEIIIISLINVELFKNYAIILPLLIKLFSLIDFKINLKTYISIIDTFYFGELNIINSLFYRKSIYLKIFMFSFSILVIFIPLISNLYLNIIEIYSWFNNLNLCIRGKLSILNILLYIFFINLDFIENLNIKYIIFILLLILPTNYLLNNVTFIDVGQGDSCLIQTSLNRSSVLIDTGSKYNYYKLRKFLCQKGIYKLDYLIISHDDEDHSGNIESLKNDFKIKNIITVGKDINNKEYTLDYLYINNFDNSNDNSLCYKLNIDDYTFLFTGDISKVSERQFVNKYGKMNVDFLKVSHHGSRTATSSLFISNTLPKIAIISTSGQYDHPHIETIETLNKYKVDYLITKQEGNISIYLSKICDFISTSNHRFVIIR